MPPVVVAIVDAVLDRSLAGDAAVDVHSDYDMHTAGDVAVSDNDAAVAETDSSIIAR